MEAKLRSVLRSPALALLLKTSIFGLALFWFRGDSYGFLKLISLILIFLFLYLRPAINTTKYWASAISLLTVITLAPKIGDASGFYLNLILILMGYMIFGVKNLVFLKRNHVYHLFHVLAFFGLTALVVMGLLSQIVYFILIFFLFKEFYQINTEVDKNTSNLISVIESMIAIQMVWVTSFLPTIFIIGTSFITLATMFSHNLLVHHLKNRFNKQNIYKDLGIFGGISLVVSLFSAWILI
ncbi:MAG: hypothetical protein COT88_02260 [Candidatus Colwellbacteria bacterium CG10_big_fil_rev_8_21_14_0_10_41_28]|uniref:Uncharacterized protein n=1 Tax=Candidatus Colwellbacteria bacterium CG10_big_fil_rev_8_21_14_0_10_41_28 TaxID=1974539 RepID=A0A2H0VGS9_9BACT|nr:MAG: hypothetical protein COT88_02260 [Candidatus Colwellbacteria bacterium CG10_big_fil_rev_8_21_14_0_10_41_28]